MFLEQPLAMPRSAKHCVLHFSVLYCSVWNCTAVYGTVLQCTEVVTAAQREAFVDGRGPTRKGVL